jgi:hypothetical protein
VWALVAVALAYLRVSRFYTAAYFELGLAVALIVALWRREGVSRSSFLPACAMILAGELIPMTLGWPSSPRMVVDQIGHVLGQPLMRYGSQGMADLLIAPAEGKTGAIQVIDIVRRTFGPFVWVLPTKWDRLTLVYSNDFVLYPGTLLWYAMQPYLVAGIWATFRQFKSAGRSRLWLVALSVFAVVYLLQFALVNLSYRQRDAMFPVFLLVALAGYVQSGEWTHWKKWYGLYWLALGILAATHLVLRAVTGA